jgi:S-adenosylmethionine synthetase
VTDAADVEAVRFELVELDVVEMTTKPITTKRVRADILVYHNGERHIVYVGVTSHSDEVGDEPFLTINRGGQTFGASRALWSEIQKAAARAFEAYDERFPKVGPT